MIDEQIDWASSLTVATIQYVYIYMCITVTAQCFFVVSAQLFSMFSKLNFLYYGEIFCSSHGIMIVTAIVIIASDVIFGCGFFFPSFFHFSNINWNGSSEWKILCEVKWFYYSLFCFHRVWIHKYFSVLHLFYFSKMCAACVIKPYLPVQFKQQKKVNIKAFIK